MASATQPRRAIVVGATSGIGAEVARTLCAGGWQVGIAGRRQSVLEQMQAELKGVVAHRVIDVTDKEAPSVLLDMIRQMGGIELYLHSAGIGWQNPQLDLDKELKTLNTNVTGCVRLVDTVFEHFARNPARCHLAVISSIAGTRGLGAAPAYSASKRFVSHYLESLQQLCAMRRLKHITVHDIRPGFVRTPLIADGHNYPMQLKPDKVARDIVHGIERNRVIITVDWRYRLLVGAWRLIPRRLWVRLPIASK